MELNQSRKKVTDGVCLMVWVHVGQLVDECHSLLCQVTIEQEKRCLGKSIITTDKRSAVYLLWHTRTNTHAPYLYIHGSYTLTHARSHTKYLHSAYPSRLPSCLLRSVWRDCTCVYLWGTYVCVHTVFSYVCVCVAVRLYSYHHYPSQYPHVHVLITLSMSNEVSQAAESLVDLFRLLLRPHSETSSSSAKDHLQGKIIGS